MAGPDSEYCPEGPKTDGCS